MFTAALSLTNGFGDFEVFTSSVVSIDEAAANCGSLGGTYQLASVLSTEEMDAARLVFDMQIACSLNSFMNIDCSTVSTVPLATPEYMSSPCFMHNIYKDQTLDFEYVSEPHRLLNGLLVDVLH